MGNGLIKIFNKRSCSCRAFCHFQRHSKSV
ncbi:hypothetical protein EOD41_03800 [Mucilaginibacter limnophilus]|uniref:Uncharacterized protein n=1 Tax=Mucilaginibacter limnophilus TaxID=1932778 RepID=A0A3S3TKL4_9SPHI|nr:hypothetical protein EOD41_03800 [Mucilaginibacter limnophilus]